MTFQLLNEKIQKAIQDLGHTTPTPIQEQAIPKVLEGCDLQASAQTGTGKTAAFILPALNKLATPAPGRGPRVLILVPTRELAMQVANESAKYSKHMPHIKTVCIYGGMPYPLQNKQLAKPYDILVATPGRLIDHIERGRIQLSRVEMLILDEADRMLDMGFVEPVEHIASLTPKNRQTLLFSATLKGSVMSLSRRLLNDPLQISIEPDYSAQASIEQQVHTVDNIDHKYRLLDHLLNDAALTQVIVFTATKHQADQLADKLCVDGHPAGALHGDMNQRQRTRTIAQLRKGAIRILIATDVAARGIDIPAISHVINFDLPMSAEDYVHRIGRTGRAKASGIALSFAAHRDQRTVQQIERFTGKKMTPIVIPGLEAKFKPQFKPHKKSWGPPRRRFR
ncbi:MAG: ATP-dependent helicase [Chlamydiae bacterium CG10_big_fil_rev_8_21_14_0_10_42_34]|nr:MAG: ATP-dependent helicase [Chlamydiae bacterium CG10_big_fil_rev_8_21_14_0_10_42_34]